METDEQELKKYTIKFVLGDWSHDGHGLYETHFVVSTKPIEHLEKLHQHCKKLFNIDIDSWFENYESRKLTDEQVDALVKAGIDIEFKDYCLVRDDGVYYVEDNVGVLNLWLDCLNLVDKSVDFTVLEDNLPTMTGPGYGLFWS